MQNTYFSYKLFSLRLRIVKKLKKFLETLFLNFVEKERGYLSLFYKYDYPKFVARKNFIETEKDVKFIFFVFRGNQWLEHVIPVYKAFMKQKEENIRFLFVSYFQELLDIELKSEFMELYSQTQKKLVKYGIDSGNYFDYSEKEIFGTFPQPIMILFCENMNVADFNCRRIYLPHYFLLKKSAVDNFQNIKDLHFDTVLVPSKNDFFYTKEQICNNGEKEIINAGYPKLELPLITQEEDKKYIIFAPSLEKETLIDHLKNGVLEVFAEFSEYHFLIKLHPSLFAGRSRIVDFFLKAVKDYNNIEIDIDSSIDLLGFNSLFMICDYGNIGAEYKLMFDKKLLYLEIPEKYKGGSDIKFRDLYGDGISTVETLSSYIKKMLQNLEKNDKDIVQVGEECLYYYKKSSQYIADYLINELR